jgi:hypothetical protein
MLPQSAQNFVLSPCLVNGLNDVSLFCTWFSSRQSQQVQLLQYYLLEMAPIYTIAWWKVALILHPYCLSWLFLVSISFVLKVQVRLYPHLPKVRDR